MTPPIKLAEFFGLQEIHASDASAFPDIFDLLRSGQLQGALVHGVYTEPVISSVLRRLEENQPGFLVTRFPDAFRSWFYGRNLNLCEANLDDYFYEAEKFNSDLGLFLSNELNPISHIAELLSKMDHGRSFESAIGPQTNQKYMFMTLRGHDHQGFIPAHCDNEFFLRPSYQHIATICEPHVMSFILAFSTCERGGETEIFDYQLPAAGTELISDDHSQAMPDIRQLASVKIRIPVGSMLIFDSGRYLHRLTHLEGHTRRWTACSFMALSKDRQQMYCWG